MDNRPANRHQLEPQQYERLYWEEDVPLKDISRGLGPRLLWAGVAMFIAALLVANSARYPDQLELPFVFRADERESVYSFPFSVYVREIYVRPGDHVEAGQPLLRLASPEIAAMIAERDGRSAKKETFDAFTQLTYRRQLEVLDRQILQLEARADQLQEDIALLDRQWTSRSAALDISLKEASDQYESAMSLYRDGVISRLDMQEREKAYALARDERANAETAYQRERLSLETSLREAGQSIAATRLEKSKVDFEQAAQEGDLGSEVATANQLIGSIFGNCRIEGGAVVLVSGEAGHVSFVFEGESEIDPGVTVLKLSRSTEADYAFVKCPPSAAGRIREGMNVHLKVASFPYYEWGVANGNVRHKSLSPDENGEYNLHVSLEDQQRMSGMLFSGLDGTAVVVLEEKTLFQYFFRALSKTYHVVVRGESAKAG